MHVVPDLLNETPFERNISSPAKNANSFKSFLISEQKAIMCQNQNERNEKESAAGTTGEQN